MLSQDFKKQLRTYWWQISLFAIMTPMNFYMAYYGGLYEQLWCIVLAINSAVCWVAYFYELSLYIKTWKSLIQLEERISKLKNLKMEIKF